MSLKFLDTAILRDVVIDFLLTYALFLEWIETIGEFFHLLVVIKLLIVKVEALGRPLVAFFFRNLVFEFLLRYNKSKFRLKIVREGPPTSVAAVTTPTCNQFLKLRENGDVTYCDGSPTMKALSRRESEVRCRLEVPECDYQTLT